MSLIISFLAFAFAIYVYILHDRKLNTQQKILNTYQLSIIEKNLVEDKKADIRVSIINKQHSRSSNSWTGTLLIKNIGKATAMNVRFRPKYNSMSPLQNLSFPQRLLPKEEYEIPLHWYWETFGETHIIVLWDDEFDKNREIKYTLDF